MVLAQSASAAAPLRWLDATGKPTHQARQALKLLSEAGDDGLQPADYRTAELLRAADQVTQASTNDEAFGARFDNALTAGMLRYLNDLHDGRVDPRQLRVRFTAASSNGGNGVAGGLSPPARFEATAVLAAALAADRLPQAVHDAAPRVPLYAALRRVLVDYRSLKNDPAWRETLRVPAEGRLLPGQSYPDMSRLLRRLELFGDLSTASADAYRQLQEPAARERYEGSMVEAVMSFQRRHGLLADGRVGATTLAALEVTPTQRVRQIELTMERLRWTPLLRAPREIVVNVPEFVLRAYETRGDSVEVKLQMKVIVGRALDTRTPLFSADLSAIEFSPYWNLPAGIARNEMLPRLKADPATYERQGYEFVTKDGQVVTGISPVMLDALMAGDARLRQRPGPQNALGDIKFVLPNDDSIYLHHTPAIDLFERTQRDFSHGCIRVQDPVALAKFVLQDQPEWSDGKIREAMGQGRSRTIKVAQPVPVILSYVTVLVRQGRPHFFNDLYGQDRLLDQVLVQTRGGASAAPAGSARRG